MQGIIVAILFVIAGAWGWNKYGSEITVIWNATKSVTTKSANEISNAKRKIGKAMHIFDNLDLKENSLKESTSTNHRVTKDYKHICRYCGKEYNVGVWGYDNLCHVCFQKHKKELDK